MRLHNDPLLGVDLRLHNVLNGSATVFLTISASFEIVSVSATSTKPKLSADLQDSIKIVTCLEDIAGTNFLREGTQGLQGQWRSSVGREGEGPLGGGGGLSRCGEGEGSGGVVTGTSTVHHAGLHRLEIILIALTSSEDK